MKEHPHFPFDNTRCVGVSADDGTLVTPCDTCRRLLWAKPSGPRSPWFVEPPRKGQECHEHWPIPKN